MADGVAAGDVVGLDAEAVAGRAAGREVDRRLLLLPGGRRQEGAVDPRDVPAGEIRRAHRQLARRVEPAGPRRSLRPHRPERIAAIADRKAPADGEVLVDRVNAERAEDVLLEEGQERLAGDALDDQPGDDIAGVRIL